MKRFLCDICNSQLKIILDDTPFFKYYTECDNGHINKGISLRDMPFGEVNEDKYKCQEHHKFSIIYCSTCKKEICIFCFKNSHKIHYTYYFHNIKKEYDSSFEQKIKSLKNIINNFCIELEYFNKDNHNNVDINSLKSLFEKEYEILEHIFDFNSNRITIIDTENFKNLFKLGLIKYEEFFTQFNSFYTYLEKYKYLKLNFPNELKEVKNFIEPKIDINNRIYNIISDNNLIPINEKYYIRKYYRKEDYFIKQNESIIYIIKDISIEENNYNWKTLFSKKLNIDNIESKPIILADNANIEKELIFFIIGNNEINKIIIKNLNNIERNFKYNIKKNQNEENFVIKGFIYLDINKIIIIKDIKGSSKSSISIYNDLFDKEKIIFKNYHKIYDYFKINKNMFAVSIKGKIIIIRIDNEDIFDEEIKFKETFLYFSYFSEKDKILIVNGNSTIYLINLNSCYPEVIQKLETEKLDILNYQYYCFEKDSICYMNTKYFPFYRITYLYKYKIKDGELKNIAKIEINKRKEEKVFI